SFAWRAKATSCNRHLRLICRVPRRCIFRFTPQRDGGRRSSQTDRSLRGAIASRSCRAPQACTSAGRGSVTARGRTCWAHGWRGFRRDNSCAGVGAAGCGAIVRPRPRFRSAEAVAYPQCRRRAGMRGHTPGGASDIHSTTQDLQVTSDLLLRAKKGDAGALDALMSRYLPRLQRWACGRLPAYARSLFDTCDLVQDTLLKTLQSFDRIESRGPDGFQAYVRQTIRNRIRDQVRWSSRRVGSKPASDDLVDRGLSPIEKVIGVELFER